MTGLIHCSPEPIKIHTELASLFFNHFGGGGLVAKSCLILATPWMVACQALLSMGFSRIKVFIYIYI